MDLLTLFEQIKHPRLLRQNPDEIDDSGVVSGPNCSNELAYFSRAGELDVLKAFRGIRYSIGSRSNKLRDSVSGVSLGEKFTEGYDAYYFYAKSQQAAQIELGMFENICLGFGTKLVSARANMFRAPDQYWETIREGEEERSDKTKEVDRAISNLRASQNFDRTLNAVDFASVALGRAMLHVYSRGYGIGYDAMLPSAITAVYGDRIREYRPGAKIGATNDSMFIDRSPDKTSLEDASAVVITIAKGTSTNRYLAYMGAYEGNVAGRCVLYESSTPWPLPKHDVAESGSIIKEGKTGNPLTALRGSDSPLDQKVATTEYPIIDIKGALSNFDASSRSDIVSPIYNSALEIDDVASSLLTYLKDGARGNYALMLGDSNGPLPQNLRRPVLTEGRTIEEFGRGADQSVHAMNVAKSIMSQVAGGYDVPIWMVIKDSVMPESGVAIAAQTLPYHEARGERISSNTEEIEKVFDIERALLTTTHGSAAMKPMLELEQKWHPGIALVPEDETARVNGIKLAEDSGYIDHVEAMRRFHRDKSEAYTIVRIEKYQADGRVEYGGYEQGEGGDDGEDEFTRALRSAQ